LIKLKKEPTYENKFVQNIGKYGGTTLKSNSKVIKDIKSIRSYERIPEKAYRWKLFILLLSSICLIYMASYFVIVEEPKSFSEDNFEIFYSPEVILIPLMVAIASIIIPTLAWMTLVYYLPWLIRKIFTILNLLSPFNHNKKSKLESLFSFDKKKFKKKMKEIKLQPLISLKESKIGTVAGFFSGVIHFIFHVWFFFYLLIHYFSYRYMFQEHQIFKLFLLIYLFIMIIRIFLIGEPNRSTHTSEEKMKGILKYYCEPSRREKLTSEEKKLYDENFSYRISNNSQHYRAYYRYGIYHNQERTHGIILFVDDLKTEMFYALRYETNRDYKYWDGHHGVDVITRDGTFTRRK